MSPEYDEIRITTSREIRICEQAIKKLKKIVYEMEIKYGMQTNMFLEKYGRGMLSETRDFISWKESYAGIGNWEARLKEYRDTIEQTK